MFLSNPTSPSFGYPKPVKDPQSYNFGSDETTPQYGGNNQRPGSINQPQEGEFASSGQSRKGSNNFAPRSQPSNGVHSSSTTGQNLGIKPSNGYSSTNSLNGYSSGPARITGNGNQNSGFNQPTDSQNTEQGFEDNSNNFKTNNKEEGGSFGGVAEEEGDYSAIPGQPDIDYPILSSIPDTSFQCSQQEFPGYYADVETRCQVFHVCANSKTYDFLCPNGTIFHQEFLVCVWWNLFDCSLAPSFYGVNANLYVSQERNDNIPNTENQFENQGLRGINDDSPTGPGYDSTSLNNPENNGYHSGEPAQPQEPSLSPEVPRFPLKQEINTQKPNGINPYLPPQQPGTGNLPLNNQNGYQNNFNPAITKNGYQDTTATSSRTNQKPRNGYNQSSNNNMRRINLISKLDGDEGYNYGNQQQQGVNEEQPSYQSNQIDRNNEFQSPQANQSSYQGSKQNRGYLPPVAVI